jgi:hypothetical protein
MRLARLGLIGAVLPLTLHAFLFASGVGVALLQAVIARRDRP